MGTEPVAVATGFVHRHHALATASGSVPELSRCPGKAGGRRNGSVSRLVFFPLTKRSTKLREQESFRFVCFVDRSKIKYGSLNIV